MCCERRDINQRVNKRISIYSTVQSWMFDIIRPLWAFHILTVLHNFVLSDIWHSLWQNHIILIHLPPRQLCKSRIYTKHWGIVDHGWNYLLNYFSIGSHPIYFGYISSQVDPTAPRIHCSVMTMCKSKEGKSIYMYLQVDLNKTNQLNPNISPKLTKVLCSHSLFTLSEGQLLGPPLLALHLQHPQPDEVDPL